MTTTTTTTTNRHYDNNKTETATTRTDGDIIKRGGLLHYVLCVATPTDTVTGI